MHATLDRGGWLDLTPQGLPLCKKRQASLAHERYGLVETLSAGSDEVKIDSVIPMLNRSMTIISRVYGMIIILKLKSGRLII